MSELIIRALKFWCIGLITAAVVRYPMLIAVHLPLPFNFLAFILGFPELVVTDSALGFIAQRS